MMPPLSLSTCWNSHRHTEGEEMLEECAELGFGYVELGHGVNYSLLPGVRDAVANGTVKVSSVHNFFPLPVGISGASPNCYEFTDPDTFRSNKAERLTMETIDYAAELGAGAIVLHLGSTGQPRISRRLVALMRRGKIHSREYVRIKHEAVARHEAAMAAGRWARLCEILQRLCEHARKAGVRLGLECRETIEEVPSDDYWEKLLAEVPADAAGYWHDFGHAMRKDALGFTDAREQFRRLAPRLLGCHVQDFQYPERDHRVPGEGVIDFSHYWPHLQSVPICVLELSPRAPAEKVSGCLKWWNQNGPALS